eukprot:14755624-Alexandrium_andersonii.AAC.1
MLQVRQLKLRALVIWRQRWQVLLCSCAIDDGRSSIEPVRLALAEDTPCRSHPRWRPWVLRACHVP